MKKGSGEKTRDGLLDAAIDLVRIQGYAAMRIEDVCARAGVTKGAFFHYFSGKEDLAAVAAERWLSNTRALFAAADYHRHAASLDRLLAYVDLRKAMLTGEVYEYACYAGTLVQDTYRSHPELSEGGRLAIFEHAGTLVADISAAAALAGLADFDAEGLAIYTQTVVQGALTLAKAEGGNGSALKSFDHLRTYLEMLLRPAKRLAI